jgi:hypothetical protein
MKGFLFFSGGANRPLSHVVSRPGGGATKDCQGLCCGRYDTSESKSLERGAANVEDVALPENFESCEENVVK